MKDRFDFEPRETVFQNRRRTAHSTRHAKGHCLGSRHESENQTAHDPKLRQNPLLSVCTGNEMAIGLPEFEARSRGERRVGKIVDFGGLCRYKNISDSGRQSTERLSRSGRSGKVRFDGSSQSGLTGTNPAPLRRHLCRDCNANFRNSLHNHLIKRFQ